MRGRLREIHGSAIAAQAAAATGQACEEKARVQNGCACTCCQSHGSVPAPALLVVLLLVLLLILSLALPLRLHSHADTCADAHDRACVHAAARATSSL